MYRTLSGQGILYVKISETDEGDRDHERKNGKFVRPIVVLVAGRTRLVPINHRERHTGENEANPKHGAKWTTETKKLSQFS